MIKTLQLKNFLNTDFKAFSIYDCMTNLPNLIDGFKISQRKAIYTVVSRDKKNTVLAKSLYFFSWRLSWIFYTMPAKNSY